MIATTYVIVTEHHSVWKDIAKQAVRTAIDGVLWYGFFRLIGVIS